MCDSRGEQNQDREKEKEKTCNKNPRDVGPWKVQLTNQQWQLRNSFLLLSMVGSLLLHLSIAHKQCRHGPCFCLQVYFLHFPWSTTCATCCFHHFVFAHTVPSKWNYPFLLSFLTVLIQSLFFIPIIVYPDHSKLTKYPSVSQLWHKILCNIFIYLCYRC